MKALTVVACALAALVFAGAGSGGGGHDLVAGGGVQTLTVEQVGDNETDVFSVGATSDPDGSNPRGAVHLTTTELGGERSFTGDVKDGCVLVTGNQAIVVGKLPESEWITIEGFGVVDYLEVAVRDNGNPVGGQPTDEALPILLRDQTAHAVCAGLRTFPTFPLDHGNFVVQDAS
jgi:hypothetical protein